MRAVVAQHADIAGWLALAAEVEDMFESPMSTDADFARILRRNIDEGTAYVVHDSGADPKVIGAAIWRPGLRRIAWLAVAEDHRRSGVGASLLSAIFEAAGPGSIVVETF